MASKDTRKADETKNEKIRNRIGFSRMEKKYEWKDHVIFMGILLGLAFWVNRNVEIKGLYMDDLYLWSCFGEQSFFQYVFPIGSTRFRFLYYLAAWLEYDDGRPEHYEVEFMVGNTRYEYEIALTSATVIKSDRESYGSGGNTSGNASGNTSYIGEDAALTAALTHAGLSASDISRQKVEFDFDDGYAIYEIEFRSGRYEYEYEVDAVSGQVLKSEMDD